MNNFKFENRNFEAFANRAGLYRVWVPLHNDGKAPLISVWIDPEMTTFESQTHEEPATIFAIAEEETADEIDEPLCCIAMALNGPQSAARFIQ